MRKRLIFVAVALVGVGAVAAVVFAQFTDTQSASGTITVSSTAADLYICEPDSTPGPDCGSDDSGADEAVFETLENIRPGEVVTWDIRIKNTGTEDFVLTGAALNIAEAVDPDADCPDNALQDGRHPITGQESPQSFTAFPGVGVFVLGKSGDDLNDNPSNLFGVPMFHRELSVFFFPQFVNIKVAAGDYEDLRLRLELPLSIGPSTSTPSPFPSPTPPTPTPGGTIEGCAGNEWNVAWVFIVL